MSLVGDREANLEQETQEEDRGDRDTKGDGYMDCNRCVNPATTRNKHHLHHHLYLLMLLQHLLLLLSLLLLHLLRGRAHKAIASRGHLVRLLLAAAAAAAAGSARGSQQQGSGGHPGSSLSVAAS